MLPEVLDFRLTSKCNMKCSFCFGTKREKVYNPDILREFLLNVKLNGVKNIVLTGGEPTLANDFEDIITVLKEIGFEIVISTNGIFWEDDRLRDLVIKNVNWVALPVDSAIKEQHNKMRGVEFDHYSLVMKILKELRELAPHIKVKIGTVATRENINNIQAILNKLPIEPDLWKIYQLSESNINKMYYERNKIDTGDFDNMIFSLNQRYKNCKTRITYMHEADRNQQYLFLDPDGSLITIDGNSEYELGNYRDDFCALEENVRKYVNYQKTNNNFKNSFGCNLNTQEKRDV